jgi:cytidine deaminase
MGISQEGPKVRCPKCRHEFTPAPEQLKSLAGAFLASSRRTFATGRKYDVPCGWCKEHMGVIELRKHWRSCPDRPEGATAIPCGWCRQKLPELEMRTHIASCKRMPKAQREAREAWAARKSGG